MEERLKILEEELKNLKDSLTPVLFDIRAYIMEAENPLRPYERPQDREIAQEKGAKDNDSRQASRSHGEGSQANEGGGPGVTGDGA